MGRHHGCPNHPHFGIKLCQFEIVVNSPKFKASVRCDSQPPCGECYTFSVKVDVSNGPDIVRKFILVRYAYGGGLCSVALCDYGL